VPHTACRAVRFPFCSNGLQRFLSPLASVAIIPFSGNPGKFPSLSRFHSPFSQVSLSDLVGFFVSFPATFALQFPPQTA
jgi:hypothetical protein